MAFIIEREEVHIEKGFLGFGQSRTVHIVERSVLMEGASGDILIGGRRLGMVSVTSGILEIKVDPDYVRIGGPYGIASNPNEVVNASDWAYPHRKIIRATHSKITFWSSPREKDAEEIVHLTRLNNL